MLLESVTLRNVGLFRHEHTLQLAPPSPRQPVTLIGGLNGSGKTTLLDALQLALYGRRARISNRGSLSYEEYLRRSVNRHAGANEEASVTINFRQQVDGRETVFRVRRAWTANERGATEHVAVIRDEKLDRVLTETWAEFAEELLPVEVAQLFFFDGEKIEGFADPESARGLLAAAIHSLLGLDVVNRLNADLIALERRKQIALKTEAERAQIDEARRALLLLDSRREELVARRAAEQNNFDRRQKDLRAAQEAYGKRGGALFDRREEIETAREQVGNELRGVEAELRSCAESDAPLLLVEDLLAEISEQYAREEAAAKSALIGEILMERDARLLEVAARGSIGDAAFDALRDFLIQDRRQRATASERVARFLNLTPETEQDLRDLRKIHLPQTRRRADQLLRRAEELQSNIVDLERKLAGVPAEDLVVKLIGARDTARAALDEAARRLSELDTELKQLAAEREARHAQLVVRIEKAVEAEFQTEDSRRIVLAARRARETNERFRIQVLERNVRRIGALVLDSFRRLLRKDSLVTELTIDKETFALELRGASGARLTPDRLSAGERQLLAVSLLWGLARASGRPLPVVIDTPLGRLDSQHRRNLVENYFPFASHQVVLLSTDKEIDAEYHRTLKPFVGHEYTLRYDDRSAGTTIETGYFH